MTRTRLKYKVGTNQYKLREDRVLGLKHKTAWNVAVGVSFMFIVAIVGREFKSVEPVNLISPLPIRAYAMEEFRISPSEAPLADLPEREANIRIIKKIWGRDAYIGIAIATCESGLRSNAFNGANTDGTWDAGLFQINRIHGWTKDELFDPVANAGIAYAKFIEQGKNPWYSSRHCWENKI